jgi:uncharacterized protein (DUF3820 family)
MIMRSYKTAKGTELPLLNLRGKQYLEVKYRLVWFREDHSDWSIETELVSVTDVSAYARATIKDEKGRIIATSHKFESIQGFPDFIEKSETGAIGRALALIGYGTQFCADELDEGKRIVDSPVTANHNRLQVSPSGTDAAVAVKENQNETLQEDDSENSDSAAHAIRGHQIEQQDADPADAEGVVVEPGQYRISFGRKYKGRRLGDIPKKEMESYLKWLESSAVKEGTTLSYQVRLLKSAFDKMYGASTSQGPH